MSAGLLLNLKVPVGIENEPGIGAFSLAPLMTAHSKLCYETSKGDYNAVAKYLISIGVKRPPELIVKFMKRQVKRAVWKDFAVNFVSQVLPSSVFFINFVFNLFICLKIYIIFYFLSLAKSEEAQNRRWWRRSGVRLS